MNRFVGIFTQPLLRSFFILLILSLGHAPGTLQASDLSGLQKLHSELNVNASVSSYALLVRHALAPGTGDPNEFSADDCSTQRNLNEEGRQQSAKIGQMLHQANLGELEVFTSQWCRCRDTALLVQESLLAASDGAVAAVSDLPILNSFFEDFERREPQTKELRQWLTDRAKSDAGQLALLISHQVNITAITGVYPASGEIVIVKTTDGEIEVIATVETL